MPKVIALVLAIAAGISVATQQLLNANLRRALDSAAWSGFVSYFLGTVCMVFLALALRDPIPSTGLAARIPWWGWSGGLFGELTRGSVHETENKARQGY